jgi:very-short-patch-repair endonuclease
MRRRSPSSSSVSAPSPGDELPDPYPPTTRLDDRARLDRGLLWWAKTYGPKALLRLQAISERHGRDAALEVMTRMGRRLMAHDLEVLLESCHSPIERLLIEPLLVVGHSQFDTVSYRVSGREDGRHPLVHGRHLSIEPQASLKSTRPDFLLRYQGQRFVRRITPQGEVRERFVLEEARMVIECDGYEFHERTRAQVERDRRRDRDLQADGYLVFRFPWSELMDNPYRCVVSALTTLVERAEADLLSLDAA